MAFRKVFCPNCGQSIQVDDAKEFCFCSVCGNKIMFPPKTQDLTQTFNGVTEQEYDHCQQDVVEETQAKSGFDSVKMAAPEDKMREVEFYYKLSVDKVEYANLKCEPRYYIKGQDLLVDLKVFSQCSLLDLFSLFHFLVQ